MHESQINRRAAVCTTTSHPPTNLSTIFVDKKMFRRVSRRSNCVGSSSQCLLNRFQYHPHTKYNFRKPKSGRRQILQSIRAVHYQFSKTIHTLHTFQTLQAAHYQFSKTSSRKSKTQRRRAYRIGFWDVDVATFPQPMLPMQDSSPVCVPMSFLPPFL